VKSELSTASLRPDWHFPEWLNRRGFVSITDIVMMMHFDEARRAVYYPDDQRCRLFEKAGLALNF